MNRKEKLENLLVWLIEETIQERVEWKRTQDRSNIICNNKFGKFLVVFDKFSKAVVWNGHKIPHVFDDYLDKLYIAIRENESMDELNEQFSKYNLELEVLFQDKETF